MFIPNDLKKKDIIIKVPKYKCSFNSNFVEVPVIIDDIDGYITVNLIKTKINTENVFLELDKNDQIGFHNKFGDFVNHYSGKKVLDSYNQMQIIEKVVEFPSNEEQSIPLYEKEAA